MIFNFPIKGEKISIVRPIVHGIVNDLKQYLKMGIFDAPIVYLDEEGVRKEVGTSTEENKEGITAPGEENILITATENYFQDSFLLYQQYSNEFKPIFKHEPSATFVTPYYSHVEVKLNISYRAQSKATVLAWLNSVKSKIRLYGDVYVHNLQYYYEIDYTAMFLLTEIYKLVKKANPDTTENISDWMQKYFTNRFGTASDAAGKNKIFIVSEAQQQVSGFFEFDGMIEDTEKIDGVPGWKASFDYLVRYMKPTDISVQFSPVVYNQVVPRDLFGELNEDGTPNREKQFNVAFDENNRTYTDSQFHIGTMSTLALRDYWEAKSVVKVPRWNEFYPEQSFSISGTEGLLDMLILLTPWDKTGVELFNLATQEEATIDEDLLDFLLNSEVPYILHTSMSVFQLLLYSDNRMRNRDAISFDKTGTIRLNTDNIDLSKVYNVRLAIYIDWSLVDPNALDRLRRWKDGKLYEKILGYVEGRTVDDYASNGGNIKTVQTFYLINYRDKDLYLEDTNG